MFDPQENWSDNPNAPKISHTVHFSEKAWVAGNLISSILYGTCRAHLRKHLFVPTLFGLLTISGIIIMLFFQCMAAFFNPVHRRGEPIKWGLVTYTVVMLLVVTVGTAAQLDVQSISFVNNREFPGIEDVLPPGPYGYQRFVNPIPVSTVRDVMFVLGNWLADGLLVSCLSGAALLIQMSDAGSSSSIVAMLSTPRISGSLPSPALCISAR